jgi:hypothetical protein
MSKRDIVERLGDSMIDFDHGDRLLLADELERLRKAVRHVAGSLEDQLASSKHDDAGDDSDPIDFDYGDRLIAAEEIERLRAALQKLAYPEWGEYRTDEAIVKSVVKIARAALK